MLCNVQSEARLPRSAPGVWAMLVGVVARQWRAAECAVGWLMQMAGVFDSLTKWMGLGVLGEGR